MSAITPIEWRNGRLRLLDQRRLPLAENYLELDKAADVAEAIRNMAVRGAPAIGIAAAYAVALAAAEHCRSKPAHWRAALAADIELLAAARPTAVNLSWALERMRQRLKTVEGDPAGELLAEARRMHVEDLALNRRLAAHGALLLEAPGSVLTHCNTGALATGGYGTALGVIRTAYQQGKIRMVYATETRPWLQGARLTVWELVREGIPVTLLTDSAAAQLLRQEKPAWVIVGADRIAANGDVANKIGTYALALLARQHGVRFMVAAPTSTIDLTLPDGDGIPIEFREPGELWNGLGPVPSGLEIRNPAFDVTPAALVDVIVTERGRVERPDAERLRALF